MTSYDNPYSRIVSWLKVLLPLAALALLSTMFLFARNSGTEPGIPYAEIADIARDPRISDPAFSGIADDGSVVAINARTIRPDGIRAGRFLIADLEMNIDAVDGSRIIVTAGEGQVDSTDQMVRLDNLARVTTSNGYAMETTGLTADLMAGVVETTGALQVQAPFGDLTAGGMRIAAGPDGTGSQMVFNQGVRLIYRPQIQESE
jgi:lipopolysaccharide export system protein LptC